MNIGEYTFEAFKEKAEAFHGYPAPGILVGGYMTALAKSRLPEGVLYDAVVETGECLPDAVQLLTPCTVGNGWLKIFHLGRYALTLYDKYTGQGYRVAVDPARLDMCPELKAWFLKLRTKKEQDSGRLFDEIKRFGAGICSVRGVRMRSSFLGKKPRGPMAVCPVCREAYPKAHGGICRGCRGDHPYIQELSIDEDGPPLRTTPVEAAVGRRALHDMTHIEAEPDRKTKGPAFLAGEEINAGDLCRLQQMGRNVVYTLEDNPPPASDWVHENDAVLAFAEKAAGPGITYKTPPKEGKINFIAETDGLLVIDRNKLTRFNLVPDVMCAARQSYLVVKEGRPLAGCRAIPLFIARRCFEAALSMLEGPPLFRVLPLKATDVGVLVTGTEVFQGLIDDKFIPVVKSKVNKLGSRIAGTAIVPDDRKAIADGVANLISEGCEIVVTTAGLSVDPEDVTRKGLKDAGMTGALYGAPILPGAMTLIGNIGEVRIFGVPACALYFPTTAFDLLLPRLLAGLDITRKDLADMAEGGFCLNCKACTFPKCPFGK